MRPAISQTQAGEKDTDLRAGDKVVYAVRFATDSIAEEPVVYPKKLVGDEGVCCRQNEGTRVCHRAIPNQQSHQISQIIVQFIRQPVSSYFFERLGGRVINGGLLTP